MSNGSHELELLRHEASACTRCGLSEVRQRVVFGEGPSSARVLFLGEAPGRMEDESGRPFCGRSGKLLDELMVAAGIQRDRAFVTSIVKCRPPENRDPKAAEIVACRMWLESQVELIQPKIVCTLGNFALRLVRGDRVGITAVHGQPESREFCGRQIILFPLFHPAAGLRSTRTREQLSNDLEALASLLG